jgi:hypothetical protein
VSHKSRVQTSYRVAISARLTQWLEWWSYDTLTFLSVVVVASLSPSSSFQGTGRECSPIISLLKELSLRGDAFSHAPLPTAQANLVTMEKMGNLFIFCFLILFPKHWIRMVLESGTLSNLGVHVSTTLWVSLSLVSLSLSLSLYKNHSYSALKGCKSTCVFLVFLYEFGAPRCSE